MASSASLDDLSREELIAISLELRELVAAQAKRISELEKQLGTDDDPPASSKPRSERKPAKPSNPDNKRKRRDLQFCRRRDEPTQTVNHKPDNCPDCGRTLHGGSPAVRRQVIDIPPVAVTVVEHVRWDRWCGVCQKRVRAGLDLGGQALGKRRFGPNLTALVANLSIQARAPVRTIQSLLHSLFQVRISTGAVVDLLAEVSRRGQALVDEIGQAVRTAKVLHSDETGWSENGRYRCLWSLSTKSERYLQIEERRTAETAQRLVGDEQDRTLITDFFASYNKIPGRRQRCWAHFKRALDKLLSDNPGNDKVAQWRKAVIDLWRQARAYRQFCRSRPRLGASAFDRRRKRKYLERRLYSLAEPYLDADSDKVPQATLARRIGIFLNELFTFVEYPEVPDDNNAAERSVRPSVILRKVCGGTRSPKGTKVKSNLMTLFGTWNVRNENTLLACKAVLANAPS
jgi:hypothetical protein